MTYVRTQCIYHLVTKVMGLPDHSEQNNWIVNTRVRRRAKLGKVEKNFDRLNITWNLLESKQYK